MNIATLPLKKEMEFLKSVFLGAGFLAFGSLIKIPMEPIPFTLHTFALYVLALTQPPKTAFASAACYLFLGSLGLPVFSGCVKTDWMVGKSAGFLLAFPLAAYMIAHLREKISPLLSILCGTALIYSFGFLWLVPFVGAATAFTKGVLIFLPSALCKALAAISFIRKRS